MYKNGIGLYSGTHDNADTILNLLSHGVTKVYLYSGDEVSTSSKFNGVSGVKISN